MKNSSLKTDAAVRTDSRTDTFRASRSTPARQRERRQRWLGTGCSVRGRGESLDSSMPSDEDRALCKKLFDFMLTIASDGSGPHGQLALSEEMEEKLLTSWTQWLRSLPSSACRRRKSVILNSSSRRTSCPISTLNTELGLMIEEQRGGDGVEQLQQQPAIDSKLLEICRSCASLKWITSRQ